MDEVVEFAANMSREVSVESSMLLLGVVIGFFVLLAVVSQYFEFSRSTTWDKFFLTPYVKFAYVSFFKPHTGDADGGQQSALESFYSAQVGAQSII